MAHPHATRPETATASLMDGIYRHQRHIYDLTRHYYLLGRDRMIEELQVPPGGTLLEVGCGTARNLVAARRRYPGARLFGIDISEEMLKSARAKLARGLPTDDIRLAAADAADADPRALFGVDGFDRIFFSYSLSMIPPWQEALATAVANLAPGGEVHCVDFSGQKDLPGWFRGALNAWLAKFHVTPRLDLGEELERLARETGGSSATRSLYRDYAMLARLKLG